jgi:Cdc6-like AAA superfamily ATPase
MLGERQKAAAAELAQWWEGIRPGGIGSHAVLLAGPSGWGRSTVLDQLPEIISRAGAPAGLLVRINCRSLPEEPAPQAAALRDALLEAEVRRQSAELLFRNQLRGTARLGARTLLLSGMAGTISLLLASLAAAAGGGVTDDSPTSENGAAARAARVVAAVSASAPVVVALDDADYLEPGLAVTVIENLIDHHESRVLVVAAVDLGSELAAALTSRARHGKSAGRVHRADADPRMGSRSRAELAGELSPDLTAAEAARLARQTRTFAEVFAAARSGPLPDTTQDTPEPQP